MCLIGCDLLCIVMCFNLTVLLRLKGRGAFYVTKADQALAEQMGVRPNALGGLQLPWGGDVSAAFSKAKQLAGWSQ